MPAATPILPHGFCTACGYELQGLTPTPEAIYRCPECGREFDPANPKSFLARPRRRVLRRIVKIVLAVFCLTLPATGYVSCQYWQTHQEAKAIQILRDYGWYVTTYDTTPPWAKAILRGHAAGLWKRADYVRMCWRRKNFTQSLAAVRELKSLRDLELDFPGTFIIDDDLAKLKGLPALRELELGQTWVSDRGLANLKGLTMLQSLSLQSTRITDAGLANLNGLKGLQHLDLKGTSITDAGLANLQNLPALQYLDLTGTSVTDAGLTNLNSLTSLQDLYLAFTSVTNAGVTALEKSLPVCSVSR